MYMCDILVHFSAENHRTQTEYDDALIIKLFVFQFCNSYSSLYYIAFFRGRVSLNHDLKTHDRRCMTILLTFIVGIRKRDFQSWTRVPGQLRNRKQLHEHVITASFSSHDRKATAQILQRHPHTVSNRKTCST